MKTIIISAAVALLFLSGCAKDTQEPHAEITQPSDGDFVSGIVQIEAYATDNDNVRRIDLYIDGEMIESSMSSSISYEWNTYSLPESSSHTIRAEAVDDAQNQGSSDVITVTVVNDTASNHSPDTPSTPSGPSAGQINISYDFASSAIDPDDDDVAIRFDWGDGNISSWSSYAASGSTVTGSHVFTISGTYYIRAQAKDVSGDTSSWSSPHAITISGSSGYWQLIYSATFSSNPNWTTNNSSRFYWNSASYNYYMESCQGDDEYAYKTTTWNSNSIRLIFDIRITSEEWGSHLGIGLYDASISVDGNFIEVHFGHDSGGKETCIYFRDQSGMSYTMYYGDWQLDTWYTFEMIYDETANSINLTVTEKSSGNEFCTINKTGLNSFSGLSRLGFSNVGTTAYGSTFIGNVDNVYYYNWVNN